MKSVLLIGPHGLGSALMTLPAVKALRSAGSFRIEVACLLPSTERLCRDVPPVRSLFDEIHALHAGHGLAALARTILNLRKSCFDYSIVLFPSAKPHYNVASRLLGARVRVGSRFPNQPWWHAWWLNHRSVPVEPVIHDCEQNLRLIGMGLGIELSGTGDYSIRTMPRAPGLVGVHPGCKAEHHFKRWGVERFAEAARLLAGTHETLRFRFFFGPDERDELSEFQGLLAKAPYRDLAAKVELSIDDPLPRLFDRIAECSVMISNDSGLMHIAAAQNVRTVAIEGPTDERITGPYGPHSSVLCTDIPCRPCSFTNETRTRRFHCIHDRQYCLTDVEPRHVVDWFDGRLPDGPIPSPDRP